MCVVSMVMDHYGDKWYDKYNNPKPPEQPDVIYVPVPSTPAVNPLTPKELEEFRKDIEEFRKLLERAREYDKKNNEPDCELESKKNKVKELAEQLGVKIDFL